MVHQNVNIGEGMAQMGNIGSIISLVFAWIFMIGGIIFGIVLIVFGIMGRALIDDGTCYSKSGDDYEDDCDMNYSSDYCTADSRCIWKKTQNV